jgi:hypothetical protein
VMHWLVLWSSTFLVPGVLASDLMACEGQEQPTYTVCTSCRFTVKFLTL